MMSQRRGLARVQGNPSTRSETLVEGWQRGEPWVLGISSATPFLARYTGFGRGAQFNLESKQIDTINAFLHATLSSIRLATKIDEQEPVGVEIPQAFIRCGHMSWTRVAHALGEIRGCEGDVGAYHHGRIDNRANLSLNPIDLLGGSTCILL